jgi:hypothetical protein
MLVDCAAVSWDVLAGLLDTPLCTVLPGWEAGQAAIGPAGRRHVRRRAKPAPAWSAEPDRECFQSVNEAAGAPAQR